MSDLPSTLGYAAGAVCLASLAMDLAQLSPGKSLWSLQEVSPTTTTAKTLEIVEEEPELKEEEEENQVPELSQTFDDECSSVLSSRVSREEEPEPTDAPLLATTPAEATPVVSAAAVAAAAPTVAAATEAAAELPRSIELFFDDTSRGDSRGVDHPQILSIATPNTQGISSSSNVEQASTEIQQEKIGPQPQPIFLQPQQRTQESKSGTNCPASPIAKIECGNNRPTKTILGGQNDAKSPSQSNQVWKGAHHPEMKSGKRETRWNVYTSRV